MKGKKLAARILFIAAFASILWLLQLLVQPKYMGKVVEGNLIPEYYQETTGHELLILGDCEVYENISPVILWEEFGISSYIRGSAQQLIPQSYYMLKDTLRREKPKVVLLSVSAMQESGQTNEAYNRMTMEGLAWSMDKLKVIQETKMEDEYLIEYLFPLLRYHSRWKELTQEDIKYLFHREKVSHNGYYMRADVRPLADFPEPRRKADYRFPQAAQEYLEKIRLLCETEGIQLILMKAPSLYPVWYDQWEEQIQAFAGENNLTYWNCIPAIDQIGLDFQTDTYDGGLHMNVYGAEKLTRYLGKKLREVSTLNDLRQDKVLSAVWKEKAEFYDQMKAAQEAEIREYGFLRQFSNP
ncbi:MAG: SGNH/GDSL hydrolase family protein [Lachnospiraceae bacterium]|nr:SGNH/GDSL hydrolase family protein [Lachnospiraceae bacterium]